MSTRSPSVFRRSRRRPFRELPPRGQQAARRHGPRTGRLLWVGRALDHVPGPGVDLVDDAAGWRERVAAAIAADETMRSDGRRTRLAVVDAIIDMHWSHSTGLVIAGHATLADRILARTGRRPGRATVGNHVRALVELGWLDVAMHGCSAAIAGRDIASIYVLSAPARWTDEDEAALQRAAEYLDGHHPDRVEVPVKEDGPLGRSFTAKNSTKSATRPLRAEHPERYRARTLRERHLVAVWLLQWMGWGELLRPRSNLTADMAHALNKFFTAGWTGAELVKALSADHWSLMRPADGVRDPVRLVLARLRAWRGPDGEPLAPPRAACTPRRGPQQHREAGTTVSVPVAPAAGRSDTLRAAMAAQIQAGRARRQAAEDAFRAARRIRS